MAPGDDEGAGTRGDLLFGTTPRLVRQAAELYAGRPAIIDGDLTLSYEDLAAAVGQASQAYLAAGLEPGDRAAIWAPNISEWIVAALGLHAAGGVLIPVNTRFKGHEAGDILDRGRARLLFTVTDFLGTDYVDLLRLACGGPGPDRPVAGLGELERVVVLRGPVPAGCQSWVEFLQSGDQVDPARAEARALAVAPEDLSDILFTSGTTGRPKGVIARHGQNLRAFRDWADVVGLREGDRYLIVNPFFHAFGYKAGIAGRPHDGAPTHPSPARPRRARGGRAGRAASASPCCPGRPRSTRPSSTTPTSPRFDLSSLRLAVTGAAAIPVELIVRMRRELGFENIITGYGLTESCGIATMCRHSDDPETIAPTSGRAIPDLEVRCVDDPMATRWPEVSPASWSSAATP